MNSTLTITLIGIQPGADRVFLISRCGRCSRSIAIHAAAFGQMLTEATFNDLLGYLLGETAGK